MWAAGAGEDRRGKDLEAAEKCAVIEGVTKYFDNRSFGRVD